MSTLKSQWYSQTRRLEGTTRDLYNFMLVFISISLFSGGTYCRSWSRNEGPFCIVRVAELVRITVVCLREVTIQDFNFEMFLGGAPGSVCDCFSPKGLRPCRRQGNQHIQG